MLGVGANARKYELGRGQDAWEELPTEDPEFKELWDIKGLWKSGHGSKIVRCLARLVFAVGLFLLLFASQKTFGMGDTPATAFEVCVFVLVATSVLDVLLALVGAR